MKLVLFTNPGTQNLTELIFVDSDSQRVLVEQVCADDRCVNAQDHFLFDEQSDIKMPTHPEGGLWEEAYSAAPGIGALIGSAIEPPSATTHPYFGRALIYLSMRTFGIGPFGWRLPSAIAGALLFVGVFSAPLATLRHGAAPCRPHQLPLLPTGGVGKPDRHRLAAWVPVVQPVVPRSR